VCFFTPTTITGGYFLISRWRKELLAQKISERGPLAGNFALSAIVLIVGCIKLDLLAGLFLAAAAFSHFSLLYYMATNFYRARA